MEKKKLNLVKKRKIELIFGKTGQGKSYLANQLIKNEKRVIIIDPLFEYENGFIFDDFESLVEYYQEHKPETFRFICRFKTDLEIEYLFKFCEVAKNLVLVLEEAEIYISPQARSSNFLRLVRYGRHYAISIIGIARRTAELSSDLKAQVNTIYSFCQSLPRDIQIMEEIGFEEIDKLPPHEYLSIEY